MPLKKTEAKKIIILSANVFAVIAIIMLIAELFAAILGKPSFLALTLYASWLLGALWVKRYTKSMKE